ncbi:MAG: FKBP-type peptidyl-prolyl cis-trans isomerase [Prevotella sp.]
MKIHNILLYLPALLLLMTGFTSCSENVDDDNEFANWQKVNDEYFDNIYTSAMSSQLLGDHSWQVFRTWSKEESAATHSYDHVVVNVLQSGSGSGCPLYSDSVMVHYTGRLLPSPSYPDGYIFDQSYYGDYNPDISTPAKFLVSGLVDGFTTALQYMHIGDRWRIYIPYQLAYGTMSSGSIPACSTLVFDVTLVAYCRAGSSFPPFKSKKRSQWVFE